MGDENIRRLNEKMSFSPDDQMGLRFDELIAAHNQQRATIVELVTLSNELKADLNLITTKLDTNIGTDTIALVNELKADLNFITTKLDADTGITDTDYSSLHTIAATDAVALDSDYSASHTIAAADATALALSAITRI